MKLAFQRKVDRIAGSLICGLLSLFPGSSKPSHKTEPRKILVILLSEMGSLVLADPMFGQIKEKYPEASVYALLFEQNREMLEIIDVMPCENIFSLDSSSFVRLAKSSISVLGKLRSLKIDTVLDCELFARISSIYSFLSGAEIRVGFHPHTQEGLFRGNFINRPVMYNPYHHISQQFVNLVQAIDSKGIPKVRRSVSVGKKTRTVTMGDDELGRLSEQFGKDFPHITGKKLILIYPGGGLLPIRAWPLEYFCRLTHDFIADGYAVGIIGMADDKKTAHEILAYCQSHNCIDLTGYTKTIRELMGLFHFASLLITNDGGPGHFAAMTPVPSIIFYGPETPVLYGPLSPNNFNFHIPLSCSPCVTAYNHRNSPCDGNNVCLKMILPEQVLGKAYEMMA